jgi:hypothetical protein
MALRRCDVCVGSSYTGPAAQEGRKARRSNKKRASRRTAGAIMKAAKGSVAAIRDQ